MRLSKYQVFALTNTKYSFRRIIGIFTNEYWVGGLRWINVKLVGDHILYLSMPP